MPSTLTEDDLIQLSDGDIDKVINSMNLNKVPNQVKDAQNIIDDPNASESEKLKAKSTVKSYQSFTENAVEQLNNTVKVGIKNKVDEINSRFKDIRDFANSIPDIVTESTTSITNSVTGFTSMAAVVIPPATTPVPGLVAGTASTISNINTQVSFTKQSFSSLLSQKVSSLKNIKSTLVQIEPFLSIMFTTDTNPISGITDKVNDMEGILSGLGDMIGSIPSIPSI